MAQVSRKNIISGITGNLVFRNLDGKQILQSRPGKIHQTRETVASGSEFRHCSRWAKHLRIGLHSFLAGQADSYMYRRLTGAFYNALLENTHLPKGQRTPFTADMKALEGFEFNIHSPFKKYFLPEITVVMDSQRQVQVTIPELEPKSQIRFPEEVPHAELVVYACATKFEASSPIVDAFFTLPIPFDAAIQSEMVWTSPALPKGYFVVVAAKLLYYEENQFMGKKYSNSDVLNPCSILFCGS
ncbi:hypothetical protein D3C87_143120 [compost metagenome]